MCFSYTLSWPESFKCEPYALFWCTASGYPFCILWAIWHVEDSTIGWNMKMHSFYILIILMLLCTIFGGKKTNNILHQRIILRRRKQFCTLRALAQGLHVHVLHIIFMFIDTIKPFAIAHACTSCPCAMFIQEDTGKGGSMKFTVEIAIGCRLFLRSLLIGCSGDTDQSDNMLENDRQTTTISAF